MQPGESAALSFLLPTWTVRLRTKCTCACALIIAGFRAARHDDTETMTSQHGVVWTKTKLNFYCFYSNKKKNGTQT